MGVFIRHEACPKCSSSDACAVYEDESRHCFSCGWTKPSNEYLEEKGYGYEYNDESDAMGREFNEEVHNQIKANTGLDSKNYRGIRSEISKYFGVRYEYSEVDGSIEKSYYPVTKNYQISGYKVRKHPKEFAFPGPIGETGKACDLFMQFRFKNPVNKTCVIACGEVDALSCYQILSEFSEKKGYEDKVAVVSATVGETGSAAQFANHYEWFDQFTKIIYLADNDDAGKEAMHKVSEVLPKGKMYMMSIPMKDANEMLQSGREKEFISAFYNSKPYTPEGVKSASEAFDEIEDELNKPRITLPDYMHRLQDMMGGGIIQGRILNLIGDTSGGKSTHINRMVHHWIYHSPVVPTIISLEATAGQYLLEMLSVHLEKNLRWVMRDDELIQWLKSEEGQKVKNELCFKEDGTPRFYLIDNRDKSIKELERQMEKLHQKHESKLFVIDVLTDLLRGSKEEHAEDHMNWQRNMNKNGVTICNLLHTRKPGQSQDGKIRKVTEFDALGTGSFVQSAAYNIVINRDKLAEDPIVKNTTEVDLPKCRGGKTGSAGEWYYDFMTMTCYDKEDYLREHPELLKPKVDF